MQYAETFVETSFSQNNQDAEQSGAQTDQNAPIMRSQATISNPDCQQGFEFCSCARDKYPQCRGGMQQPPPYASQ